MQTMVASLGRANLNDFVRHADRVLTCRRHLDQLDKTRRSSLGRYGLLINADPRFARACGDAMAGHELDIPRNEHCPTRHPPKKTV
jgi:hypothetical protein